jgi:glutathione synthase/RimK-type ligase-like ATP-grasp enzyme
MKSLGLAFGTIDMKVDVKGNYFFLEVNPSGQWIYIEMETGQPITATLAAYLAGR